MDYKINKNFPHDLSVEYVNEELHYNNKKIMIDILKPLLEKIKEITRPKSIFFQAKITEKDDHHVKVNAEIFESQLLKSYVETGDLVYPYIVTVGTELDEYAKSLTNPSGQYMIDEIMNLLVNIGKVFVEEEVRKISGWDKIQDYVPGNGEDWSKIEQARLFNMFGDETNQIGVTLGDHGFVLPGRSTIGILSKREA